MEFFEKTWKSLLVSCCGLILISLASVMFELQKSNIQQSTFIVPKSAPKSHFGFVAKNQTSQKAFDFSKAKKILYYTSFFGAKDFDFGFGNEPFIERKCPDTNCYTTNNKTLLGKQQGVCHCSVHIFHLPPTASTKCSLCYMIGC